MLKTTLLKSALLILVLLSYAHAVPEYKIGQKIYNKTCYSCHGNDTRGAAMFTQEGWSELFALDGQKLTVVHSANIVANQYFGERIFQKERNSLFAFLHKYASDTPDVPECD